MGLCAALLGSSLIAGTSAVLLPFCAGAGTQLRERVCWVVAMTIWGALGSLLDSVLGGMVQASVVDKKSGKVVEGTGGKKVLVHPHATKSGDVADTGDLPGAFEDSVQLRNTEAVANTATLRGSRVAGLAKRDQPGRVLDPGHESRRVEAGWDLLDNNAVNLLMAAVMSLGAMGVASWVWDVPVGSILG